ncbi:protein eva-1-like protein C-like [Platysternon megacephalum]|uniref:Protein eva-1-like protein C-like n=1 Tax=Platysternon megacephalum TaxID=55544 RepID=A0A4D9DPC9_9SAUR|nr:protein eva-1-like protein C-like [Platysternon megacephalum]
MSPSPPSLPPITSSSWKSCPLAPRNGQREQVLEASLSCRDRVCIRTCAVGMLGRSLGDAVPPADQARPQRVKPGGKERSPAQPDGFLMGHAFQPPRPPSQGRRWSPCAQPGPILAWVTAARPAAWKRGCNPRIYGAVVSLLHWGSCTGLGGAAPDLHSISKGGLEGHCWSFLDFAEDRVLFWKHSASPPRHLRETTLGGQAPVLCDRPKVSPGGLSRAELHLH